MTSRRSLAERVPLGPSLPSDSKEEATRIIRRVYAPLTSQAFEPWIGLKAIHPFAEWIPADADCQAEWAVEHDNDPEQALIDFPDYGPFAALAGMHPRMAIRTVNQVAGVAVYGLDADFELTDKAEPAWVLHGRIWDDVWRAQSSALCAYLATYAYAQSPTLSMAELLRRAAEGETAVTGGGTYLNRYGARTNSGWYRCAPAMCSIGTKGNDHPDEPATCYALDSHVTLLEPLQTSTDMPAIPIRHALQQCTVPEEDPFTGARVWTHLNNRPDEYLKELDDLNGVFLISAVGSSIAKLTSIIMLEGYYDWVVSIMLPEIPHGLYLSQFAQSTLRHVARRIKQNELNQEQETIFQNWLRDILMQNVYQQVAEVVFVSKITWGNWLGQIVLHDPDVIPADGVVHELLTGVFSVELWKATVTAHWAAIRKATERWDVDWQNLNGMDVTLPHIVDRLPKGSCLDKSSNEWMMHGQVTSSIINMKHHPHLDLEWIEPGKGASTHIWESDSTLCRFHERELVITSRVEEDPAVELTWEEDLTPGKEKKVLRVEAILGILPELTSFLSQYVEQDGSWTVADSFVPADCELSVLSRVFEEHFEIERVPAMTLVLALAACGVLQGTGEYDCWSQVGSEEMVEGIKTINCDIPIELPGRLCRAKSISRTYFAVPLTPNDTAVFDVGDLSVVDDEFEEMPILHAERAWMHSESGHVEDWVAGLEEPLPICKLGLRPRLLSRGRQSASRISGPVPQGSSLEWVIGWAEEKLGIGIPLSNDEIASDHKTITLKMRRSFWKLFECEKISGSISVRKLVGVNVEFKRLYAGIFQANTWVALEKVIRDLATKAGVADSTAQDYVSISEVTNCVLWYAALYNQSLKIGPEDNAVWIRDTQRGEGFLCDRNMVVPSWMGRRIKAGDELEVIVTEKQAINFGPGSAAGNVQAYQTVAVPTSGHARGEFVGGNDITLSK